MTPPGRRGNGSTDFSRNGERSAFGNHEGRLFVATAGTQQQETGGHIRQDVQCQFIHYLVASGSYFIELSEYLACWIIQSREVRSVRPRLAPSNLLSLRFSW